MRRHVNLHGGLELTRIAEESCVTTCSVLSILNKRLLFHACNMHNDVGDR
jgi:hypothetical protein